MNSKPKILIIQTAFIGDVILATAMFESILANHPAADIEIVVRKGNESLFQFDERLSTVHVWDKQLKWTSFWEILKNLRRSKYDILVCAQRFFTAGLLGSLVKAKSKICFSKNPLSFMYDIKVKHTISARTQSPHEVERNNLLLSSFCSKFVSSPKLILGTAAEHKANALTNGKEYFVLAPSSVWFTKKLPTSKWIELINKLKDQSIFVIGAPGDKLEVEHLISQSGHNNIMNMCGQLNLLESAALIKHAKMTYVNDSAPLHLASSTNANVTSFFCSTVPEFGFGPLSEKATIVQVEGELPCRPCGLHGKKECPKGHFKCGHNIDLDKIQI